MKKIKGSLTVETALVLPIFLFLSITLISFLDIMNCYIEMEYALHETAREMAIVYYPLSQREEYEGVMLEAIAEGILIEKIGIGKINSLPIKNGMAGINIFRSDIDNEYIELVITYKVSPLLDIFHIGEMRLINKAKIHTWTGYQLDSKDEVDMAYVFITDYRSVYHIKSDCSHLFLDIKNVSKGDIDTIKNSQGKKYTACKICVKDQSDEMIYVTEHGEAYHNTLSCSGLKRTVYKVRKEEVAGLPMCQRCMEYMIRIKKGE